MRFLIYALIAFGLVDGALMSRAIQAQAQTRQALCCYNGATPTPSPSPSTLPAYVFAPTNTCVYCATPGVGDPQLMARVDALPTDANSTSVLTALHTKNVWFNSSESNNYWPMTNNSPSPVPSVVVTATPGGHSPPLTANAVNGTGGAGGTIPWSYTGFFLQNGCQANCTSDNHWQIMDPVTKFMCQGDGGNTDGSTFFATYTGFCDSADHSYCSQIADKGDNFTVSGLPSFGAIVYSNDIDAAVAGTPINHPVGIVVSIDSVQSGTGGVNLSQLTTNNVGSCSGGDTVCFRFGDWGRLKPSYNCATAGSGDAATVAFCTMLQQHGWIVVDLGALPGPHTGVRVGTHTDAVTSTLYNWWHGLDMLSNMDLIQRGSIHC